MLAHPVDKDDLEPYGEMKRVFEKSVVAVADIPAGATIERGMLAAKKPCGRTWATRVSTCCATAACCT